MILSLKGQSISYEHDYSTGNVLLSILFDLICYYKQAVILIRIL